MTEDEFFQRLRALNYDWSVNAFCLRSQEGHYCCPITAVAISMGFQKRNVTYWSQSAIEMGLPMGIAKDIAQAADHIKIPNFNEYVPKLLEACNVPAS